MVGDGSDGHLYIANGQTVNLNLNQKYQFKTITIEAGGTLSTASTSGSVMYLACQGKAEILGNITLNGKASPGVNNPSVVIDGINWVSPSVQAGGVGGAWNGYTGASQGEGYGGGGMSGFAGNGFSFGGNGGSSGGGGGGGSGHADTGSTQSSAIQHVGGNGGVSAGGGGGAYAYMWTESGGAFGRTVGYGGGGGGGAYSNHGGNGNATTNGGFFQITYDPGDGSSMIYDWESAGGGGAGGAAGRPGVHLVIRAGEVYLGPSSQMNISGTAGGSGGNGGTNYDPNGANAGGLGGGGGGGGNAGSYYVYYGARYTAVSGALAYRNGGAGGSGGVQGHSGILTGGGGLSGNGGNFNLNRGAANIGAMSHMFN